MTTGMASNAMSEGEICIVALMGFRKSPEISILTLFRKGVIEGDQLPFF